MGVVVPVQDPSGVVHNPARGLTRGVEFGLGVGRSGLPEHYRGFNIAYGESRERFFETLDVLHRLPALREAIPFSSLSAWMSPGGKIPHAQVLTSMRLFADRVIPRLTRRAGGFALADPR